MNNLTLNIYKAFGIYKQERSSYIVDFEYENYSIPKQERIGTPTGEEIKSSGQFKSARKAMTHAIKHINSTNGIGTAMITLPEGGSTLLFAHPKTNNLTLRHVIHSPEENKALSQTYRENKGWEYQNIQGIRYGGEWYPNTPTMKEALTRRDTSALNRIKHLHKNSLLSLGNLPMDIDTSALYNLPEELHMNTDNPDALADWREKHWGLNR